MIRPRPTEKELVAIERELILILEQLDRLQLQLAAAYVSEAVEQLKSLRGD